MYQFYTVEITKDQAGEFAHDVKWHFDADATKAQLKGEAAYHEIMSRAAVSEYAEHAAILFSSEGFPLMHGCYKHEAAPAAGNPGETDTSGENNPE